MKFKFFAGLALTSLALAACKVEVDGTGGFGGSGDDVTTGNGATTGATKAATTGATNVATTASVAVTGSGTTSGGACVDEATCDECQQCAFDGACNAQAQNCAQGSDCATVNMCLNACPEDNPATADMDEFFQCACGAEAAACDPTMAPAGTCFGDTPAGVQPFFLLLDCLFGDGMGNDGECGARMDC